MGIELGRISGPLLAENLLRNGIDLAFEDNLLYLDVTNNRIGIRKDNPGYTLDITGTTDTTNLIVDTSVNIGNNLVVNTNLIQNISGAINIVPDQTTNPVITATQFGTLNLRISDRLIENITNGSNINISPNGTGQVIFNTTKVNVDGDLHATGDITWDGSITFGDSNTDNIAITSLIDSNVIPKTHLAYDLGSVTNKWKEANLENLTATSISTNGVTASDINITLRVGNTWYVSKNGLDTNYGDHLHATFLTVKKALLVAEPGDEIVVFPGAYEEIFPLTVPANVIVRGDSIRAVSITPTALTKSNDAFLLNSGTTVENITVKDYYYNTLANTGYAFKFASGYAFNGKSPYVRNVSVITKDSGLDLAGYGALVDGSVVASASTEASMLFHSCTFITPGAKALVLTNGVRVEWLNSFTYFASVGTELTNGTLGRAGLGVKFGGELRSINSANVYGNYGITANGSSTLAYIIGHNFGYIGSGLDSSNDPRNVIQANEVVESNGGKIYYESVDNKGDVRVGNIFYVSQETGQISFDASAINFTADGSIVLESPSSSTYIQAAYVQTGNIRFYDNTVESLAGAVNLTAQSGSTYLNTDVFVTGNLSITNDVKVKGNVYLGDTPLDLITIVPDLTQDINPDVTDSFTLGTDSKRWNNLFIKLVNVDNVTEITTNTISTLTTDTDLKFVAAGTGEIHVATTNVQVDNDLTTATGTAATATLGAATTVTAGTFNTSDITISGHTITTTVTDSDLELSANGVISVPLNPFKIDQNLTVNDLTTLINVNIGTALNTALLTQIGNYTQTGDRTIYGDVETTGNATFLGEAQFNDFNINTNTLSTTTLNGDLKLGANGTGIVNVQTTNVLVNNDLTVDLNIDAGYLSTLATTTAGTFTTGDITISDNTINTTVTNSNLILQASTGNLVVIPTNDVELSQKLTVTNKTTVIDVNIGTALDPKLLQQVGNYTQTGDRTIYGDVEISGNVTFLGEAQFNDFNIVNNTLSTTQTDSDVKLGANGSGIVNVQTTNVLVNNDLTVDLTIDTNNLTTVLGTTTAGTFYTGNITVSDNTITTTVTNSNLILSASTSNVVDIPTNDVELSQQLTVTGKTTVTDVNIGTVLNPKLLQLTGLFTQTGDKLITGDYRVTGNATFTGEAQFYNINVNTNVISTTLTDSDLRLQANGSGIIQVKTTDVQIDNDLTVGTNLTINGTTSLKNTVIRSETLTPTTTQVNQNVSGTSTPTGFFFYGWADDPGQSNPPFDVIQVGWTCVQIPGSVVTVVGDGVTNYDITITGGSFASGGFYSFTGDVLTYGPKTLTLVGNLNQTGNTDITGLFANNNISIVGSSYLTTSDIKINSNEISVLSTNNDLNIVGATTGGVVVENQLKILNNVISNVRSGATTDTQKSILLSPNGTGNTVINSTKSLVIPVGNNSTRSMSTGEIRFNNLTGLYEGAISTGLVSFFNIYDSDRNTYITPELTLGANDNTIRFGINGVVRGTITSTALTTSNYNIDNVSITGNTLSNVNTSTDLNIATAGTGRILINSLPIKDSTITNSTNSAIILESTITSSGAGYVKFGGTGAVVFPYGPTEDRRLTPEIGETRYNSTLEYMEVFDGTAWLSAAGGGAGATLGYIEETLNLWSIVLG
jgi:hypothetical protein